MAGDPVVIPIQMQVQDLDFDNIDPSKVSKQLEERIGRITKGMNRAFGQIDPTQMNKSIESAMLKVENSINKVREAWLRYDNAVVASGKSSPEYKENIARLQEEEKELENLRALKGVYEQDGELRPDLSRGAYEEYLKILQEYEAQYKKVEQMKADSDPRQFANLGGDTELAKMAAAYGNLQTKMKSARKDQIDYNNTVRENHMSDEFIEAQKHAEKLKGDLETLKTKSEKMADLGATDKQWKALEYDIQKVNKELNTTTNDMKKMVTSGEGFRFGGDANDQARQLERIKQLRKEAGATKRGAMGNVDNGLGQYSDSYKAQLKDLTAMETAAEKLKKKYEEMQALGAKPSALAKVKRDAEELKPKLDALKSNMEQSVQDGTAFRKKSTGQKGQARSEEEMGRIASRTNEVSSALNTVSPATSKWQAALRGVVSVGTRVGTILGSGLKAAGQGISKVWTLSKSLAKSLGNVVRFASRAVSAFKRFGKQGGSATGGMSKGFKKLSRNVMLFGLGFRSAYYLVKRLRTIFSNSFMELASESDEVNQSISRLKESFNRLKGAMVTVFQPIVTVLIPIAKNFLDIMYQAAEAVGSFNATLTGQGFIYRTVAKECDAAAESAGNAQEKLGAYDKLDVIQKDTNKTGVTYEKAEVEGAASDFANLVKKAWESADFNSVGEFVGNKLLELLNKVQTTFLPKVTNFVNKLVNSALTGLQGLGTKIPEIGQSIGTALNQLVANIDFAKIGQLIGTFKTTLWRALYAIVTTIDWPVLGTALAQGVQGLIDSLGTDSLANTVSEVIDGIVQAVGNFIDGVDWGEAAVKFATSINRLFGSIDQQELNDTIKELVETFVTTLVTFLETVDWSQIVDIIVGAFGAAIEGLGEGLSATDIPFLQEIGNFILEIKAAIDQLVPVVLQIIDAVAPLVESILGVIMDILPVLAGVITRVLQALVPVVTVIVDTLVPIFEELIGMILPVLVEIIDLLIPVIQVIATDILPPIAALLQAIMPLISSILKLVMAILKPILKLLPPLLQIVGQVLGAVVEALTPIIEIVTTIVDYISGPLSDVIGFIGGLITGFIEGVLMVLIGAVKAVGAIFTTVATVVKTAFNNIKSTIGGAWSSIKGFLNGILTGVEKFVNGIVGGINKVIDALNGLSFEIPDWVPGVGGAQIGFNIAHLNTVSIPKLAQGAVIPPNKEFMAMLGDQPSGTNIEAPLDTIKQALAEVMLEMGNAASHEPIILQLDGKTVAKVVWEESDKRYKQTGKYAFA